MTSTESLDTLEEIISLLSKTIKGDNELIYQILFNGLSAFTKKPTHLMIMEKSSEGKTYPALEIAKHFPKENTITLGSATPQSFKYEHGIEVDENYNPIQSKGPNQNTKTLVDLRNKWIIFKEPPDHKLIEALFSTLSSDEEFNEHKFVNNPNGTNKTFTVVIRGTPAVLVCSAKDETRNSRWDEIKTRFNVISPVSSSTKYRDGMDLVGKSKGLPKSIYEKFVISKDEKARISFLIAKLIEHIKYHENEILNPFITEMSKHYPQEAGFRWREYARFMDIVKLHCLCYLQERPKVITKDEIFSIVTLSDIKFGLSLMKDNVNIPPNKLNWFRDIFYECWKEKGIDVNFYGNTRKCIIGQDLKNFIAEKKLGNNTVKQIRETYLDTLFEHGLIEKESDPRNKTREVYWPVEDAEKLKDSSLIVTTSLDESCVNSFLDGYQLRRLTYKIFNKTISEEQLIQYILSTKNVISYDDFVFKKDNDSMTINEELVGGENSE